MKFVMALTLGDIVGLIIVGGIIILFISGCAVHAIHELFSTCFSIRNQRKRSKLWKSRCTL